MTDLRLFEMKSTKGPVKPLFGFAVEEYMAAYGRTEEQLANSYGFGMILNGYDLKEGLLKKLKDLSDDFDILMFVFGFNGTLYADIKRMEAYLNDLGYFELKDVYDDRMVFAKGA